MLRARYLLKINFIISKFYKKINSIIE